MNYWLLKSEPGCFSIDDLKSSPKKTSMWDGVRNYQARNFLCDMQKGDLALFYHSVTGTEIVGLAEITSPEAYPDPTQWDPEARHFDPQSPHDKPRWYVVDVTFMNKFKNPLPLVMLREVPELAGMELLRKGSRLSVQPVSEKEFKTIMGLAGEK